MISFKITSSTALNKILETLEWRGYHWKDSGATPTSFIFYKKYSLPKINIVLSLNLKDKTITKNPVFEEDTYLIEVID